MSTNQKAEDWWRTEIIEMSPGQIHFRGYAIEDLIGNVSFVQMIWLMLRGDLPSAEQATLMESEMLAGVDHGPQAPSIAIARMSMTCGVALNNAIASAVNVLGDVHGGAGEQAVELYTAIHEKVETGTPLETATAESLAAFFASGNKFVPGFGHRFHPIDPRAPRLLQLVDDAVSAETVSGGYAAVARAIEAHLHALKGKRIPMNIDGATAVIYAELGFAAPLARGLFCLSRSVGILAHAWEQSQQGGRNKGPLPKEMIWTYTGHPRRPI
tara:strand:- start:10280 stop:11089 length:810 start_codon:yes stop_codon:yes gene_type:complete